MTTIDHQKAAVDAVERVLYPGPIERAIMPSRTRENARALVQAAAPHLRAEWEQPIRGICEQAIQDKEDSLCRMFNGEPFPAMIPATAVLDLLEGGGE